MARIVSELGAKGFAMAVCGLDLLFSRCSLFQTFLRKTFGVSDSIRTEILEPGPQGTRAAKPHQNERHIVAHNKIVMIPVAITMLGKVLKMR